MRRVRISWVVGILSIVGLLMVGACGAAISDALSLPDGRAYELVSPADKSGGVGGVAQPGSNLYFAQPFQSSPDGGAVAYAGEEFYGSQLGSINQYVSIREATGWSAQNLTAPGPPGYSQQANFYAGFSPDLSEGVSTSRFALPGGNGAPPGYENLYLRQGGVAGYRPLITVLPPHLTAEEFGVRFEGGNSGTNVVPAFSHIIFSANDALTPEATPGGENLYEWVVGRLRAVNILPGATKSEPNASFGINYNAEITNKRFLNIHNAISSNGSRIFWTDMNNESLYMREDGERTVLISAGAQYQDANNEGTKVFYTRVGDLYEFDTTVDSTTDLAPSGEVQGMVGASDNGSYVYFVAASAKLAGNENANGETAKEGADNLYLRRRGGATSFIATLAPQDNEIDGRIFPAPAEAGEGDWRNTWAARTARVSPSGRFLALDSAARLTEYNSMGVYEVYLYDADSGQLRCASCNPGGAPPAGSTFLPAPAIVGGIHQPRSVDDSGQVFFSTPNALVPQDTNGVMDVYEYENGRAYLLSSGTSEEESNFVDASESGEDVFFTTRQQLVPQDQDQIIDLYDARVNGGFPMSEAVAPCSGDGCLGAPGAPPASPSLVTSSVGASGNLAATAKAPLKSKPKKLKTKRRSRRKGAKRGRARRAARGRR
jgi:hypothetical protein